MSQSPDDQDADVLAIQELRISRDFDQAERKITQLMRDLDAREFAKRVLLQIELLKSKSARAFEEKSDSRFESYQSVIEIAERFSTQQQSNPNLILIEVQKAMTALKFGELLRKEIEAGKLGSGATGARKIEEGFKLLRIADREFEEIDQKLNLMIPAQPRKTVNGKLNQRQLISLQNQVRYQRVKTRINRGLLYGANDPDNRVSVITTARNDLEKVIPMIEKVDPSWWTSRLDLVICLREVGEYRECQQLFQAYPIKDAPPHIQLAFRAEAIRLALELKDLKTAERVLTLGREIDGQNSPDFDFAVLQYLIQKNEADDRQDHDKMQDELVKVVQSIEKQHGAYWGRRANLAMVASARVTGSGGSTTLIRVAQDFYRQKKFEESIEHFEKAADAARKELNQKLELELLFQAIVIHRKLDQHDLVVEKCERLTRRFSKTNRAAAVSLLGIHSAAQLVRAGKLKVEKYLRLLDFHLENWPHHPTIAKVAYYRGEYDSSQGNFAQAAFRYKESIKSVIEVSGAIDLDSFESSMTGLISSLQGMRTKQHDAEKLKQFSQEFDGSSFFASVRDKTSDLESTLNGWATYVLEYEPAQLKAVFETLVEEQEPQGALLVNLVRTAVLSDGLSRVSNLKSRLAGLSEKNLETLLRGFENDWDRGSKEARSGIATCVSHLQVNQSMQFAHWKLLAACLLEQGKRGEAVDWLQETANHDEKSLAPLIMLARTLAESDEMEMVTRALNQWRKVLSLARPKSDIWFESKLQIARSHYRLDDFSKALSILELMQAIPPGWNESIHKKEFDELYRQVQSKGK